jgi:hypothetical protein
MSLLKRRTRRTTILATVVIMSLAGVAAFAYWTTSGEGTGEAHVNNPSSNLQVESTPASGLFPGASTEVTVKIHNISTTESVHTELLETVLTGNSQEATGCKKTWFTVSPATQGIVKELAPEETLTAKVTVTMLDPETENQDACKGTTVNLHFLAH